ncbi:hypothetical protein HYPDE_26498 [Hyphomicrobium denitrificans 1NES1]|uniref:Uncharacterized protein n=1 Tax=Hyphomicrobium denitrificans 1NES1 TaxID=670307 RepID=N0BA54_9HYPH|nr:hypothetical protein [Hyphomicrobium denitrificans]AGK56980.1 hypothetical protein HYPDE_26498 [Hyphomicrobium denitrificans 1NES1]
MWDYPKSAKHRAFIDQLQATHDSELARVKAAEKKQTRAADAQEALDEIKAKLAATRAQTARLRAERLARAAANPAASSTARGVRKQK